jgi:hypothetical protein
LSWLWLLILVCDSTAAAGKLFDGNGALFFRETLFGGIGGELVELLLLVLERDESLDDSESLTSSSALSNGRFFFSACFRFSVDFTPSLFKTLSTY